MRRPSMSLCKLPSEILLKIFSFVEEESVFVLPRICRRWREICSTLTVQEIKWKHHPMKIEAFLVLLSKFRGFKLLDFDLGYKKNNSDQVGSLIVMKITETYSGLKSLNLSWCSKITDVGILKIAEGCPQLQSLNLSYCSGLTDVGISKMAKGCPQLQSLDLSYCKQVTDVGISKIGEGCKVKFSLD